jgi:transposase
LTLSSGEKVEHPREVQRSLKRIAQAQRGQNRRLVARLNERLARQVRDRNHKLARRLVAENELLVYSRDRLLGLARAGFGGSVRAAAHGQLRTMLKTKSLTGASEFVEVSPVKSTLTCSACGALAGPRGRAGLQVRHWVCAACGAAHDRDVNAAVNTRRAGDPLCAGFQRAGGGQPLESDRDRQQSAGDTPQQAAA